MTESTADSYGYYWPKEPLASLLHGISGDDLTTLLMAVGDNATWKQSTKVEGYHAMRYSASLAGNIRLRALVCPDPSFGHARLAGNDWALTVQLYTYSPSAKHTEKVCVPTKTGRVQFNAYDPVVERPNNFKRDLVLLRMFDLIP